MRRVFDLGVVQRGLREQIEAGEQLFDVISELRGLQEGLPEEKRVEVDDMVRRLLSVSERIVYSTASVSENIQQFMKP